MRARTYCIVIALILMPSAAALAFDDDLPPGFSDYVDTEQITMSDLIFADVNLGEVVLRYDEQQLSFVEPEAVYEKIKNKLNPARAERVASELTRGMPYQDKHTDMKAQLAKGRVMSAVFDKSKYEVELLLHPDFLPKKKNIQAQFLPDSTAGFASWNHFDLTSSGNDAGTHTKTLNHHGYLSQGNWHLDYTDYYHETREEGFADSSNFHIRDMELNWHRKQYRTSFGYHDTVSTNIIPSLSILGASFDINYDLLQDIDNQVSTPLEVSIVVPSYVDVYRDDQLLTTEYFGPGNHYIDTTRFPEGAYSLRVVTRTLSNIKSTKIQYFIKSYFLPLINHPTFNISYGKIVEQSDEKTLPQETAYYSLAVDSQQRVHKYFGIEEHLTMLNENEIMGEFAFIADLPYVRLSQSTAYSNNRDRGYSLSAAGKVGSVYLNTFYRRLYLRDVKDGLFKKYFDNTEQSESDIGAHLTTSWHDFTFDVNLSYALVNDETQHELGVEVSRDVKFKGNDFNIALDVDQTENSHSVFFKINWTFESKSNNSSPWYMDSTMEWQASQSDPDEPVKEQNLMTTFGKKTATPSGELDVGATAQKSKDSQYLSQYINYHNRYFNYKQQLDESRVKDLDRIRNYLFEASTTVVATSIDRWDLNSSEEESGVMLYVKANKPSPFNVFIDGQKAGSISANEATYIPLSEFDKHLVSVYSEDGSLSVTNNEKHLVLYPGNIEYQGMTGEEYVFISGVFVTPEGQPLPFADINSSLDSSETLDDGYGQLQTLSRETITLTSLEGQNCSVKVADLKISEGIAEQDEIICH